MSGLKWFSETLVFSRVKGRSDRSSRSFLNSPGAEEADEPRQFPVCDLMQEFEKVLVSSDLTDRSADSGCAADDDGSTCSSDEYLTADEDSDDGTARGTRVRLDSSGSSGSSFKSTHSVTDLQRGPALRHTARVFIVG